MKWFFSLLADKHTLLIVAIALAACYTSMQFNIRLHHNMMLYGLIVSFPFVFSLQSAFKRRDKALEYLGLLRAGLESTRESFLLCDKLPAEHMTGIQTTIKQLQERLFNYLEHGQGDPQSVLSHFGDVTAFMIQHRQELNKRVVLRVQKYMAYVYKGASFLVAVKTHRTSEGVRFFSRVFITFFPVLQAPIMQNALGNDFPAWGFYVIAFITALTLAALLRIQKQLEDPFDQQGLDDVKIDQFRMQ